MSPGATSPVAGSRWCSLNGSGCASVVARCKEMSSEPKLKTGVQSSSFQRPGGWCSCCWAKFIPGLDVDDRSRPALLSQECQVSKAKSAWCWVRVGQAGSWCARMGVKGSYCACVPFRLIYCPRGESERCCCARLRAAVCYCARG
jgi:hypothetical protein